MRPTQHWLIYGLGGGWGHVTRGLALARAAARGQIHTTLCVNSELVAGVLQAYRTPEPDDLQKERRDLSPVVDCSRWSCSLPLELPGVWLRVFDPHDTGPTIALGLRDLLISNSFDRLIIDTFPRGLGGELDSVLSDFNLPKVLVHRDLNPVYVTSHQLDDFVTRHYDFMVVPGEHPTLRPNIPVLQTPRWLIGDPSDVWPREQARRYWLSACRELDDSSDGGSDSSPIVVVVATGRAAEIQAMQQLAQSLSKAIGSDVVIRCVSLPGASGDSNQSHVVSVWPLLPLLSGVDLVIGAGGYNTVAETTALQIPLLGFARERRYDRQSQRLHDTLSGRPLRDLVDQIHRTLAQRTHRQEVTFENGVHLAAARIAAITR